GRRGPRAGRDRAGHAGAARWPGHRGGVPQRLRRRARPRDVPRAGDPGRELPGVLGHASAGGGAAGADDAERRAVRRGGAPGCAAGLRGRLLRRRGRAHGRDPGPRRRRR
ncbi:unnamed protein product, partial [Heterosigma akashiwo]